MSFVNSSIPLDKTIVVSLLIAHFIEFGIIVSTGIAFCKFINLFQNQFEIFFISICFLSFIIFIVAIKGIEDIIHTVIEKKNYIIHQQTNTIEQMKNKLLKQDEELVALRNSNQVSVSN